MKHTTRTDNDILLTKHISYSLPSRRHFLFISLTLGIASLTCLPAARATCNDGCDTNELANTFLGEQALSNNTTGFFNTAAGYYALSNNTTGAGNVAIGVFALTNNNGDGNTTVNGMANNTTGNNNTSIGSFALDGNQTARNNTAVGYEAMAGSVIPSPTGTNNTATGYQALSNYSTGSNNAAMGYHALFNDATGGSNTASGYDAMYFNTSGNFNTAYGRGSLYQNTTASNNTGIGYRALNSNKIGTDNTATGGGALQQNTANYNIAMGYQALNKTNTGHDNTAIGINALQNNTNGYSNVALGQYALQSNTSGFNNIAVGGLAGFNITTGNNNIDIGNQGLGFESNVIRIGTPGTHTATLISGIYNVAVSGLNVVIGSSGQLGTTASSARYKENIQPMNKASEAILSLQPVTFRYKKELDPEAIPQFGLVAEQVEKVDPDLVARDDEGKPYSVRYEAVNAMLLNEFLKEHQTIERQEKKIESLELAVKEQAAQIQKVISQSQLRESSSPVVVNAR